MLTKAEVNQILINNKCKYWQIIKCHHQDFYSFVNTTITGKGFGEKLYRWLNNDITNLGLCLECGKECKFDDIFYGYRKHCSLLCSNNSKNVQQKKEMRYLENYNTINPSKSELVKQKKKETFFDHYGVDCNLKLDSVKNRIKQTNLKKYGTEYPIQSQGIRTKILNDNYNRFYDDNKYSSKIIPLFSKEEYKGVELVYKWKCSVCNVEFEDHLQDGKVPKCPKCYPQFTSIGQMEVLEFIRNILPPNTLILKNDRKTVGGIELDIYIPRLKLAIEYNGLYYHSEISGEKDKNYHLNKLNKCLESDIRLIQIIDCEWLNKQEIIKSRLKSILSNTTKIFARKCEIKQIDNKTALTFLESNHLQGAINASINLGLYNKNNLIAVMTLGMLRKCLGQKNISGEYEMYRFCSKINTSIIGGASKLLNYFIKTYNPIKITSYADRRWSSGNLYKKLGFKFVSNTKPNYFYTKTHGILFNRFSYRKDQLSKKLKVFDINLSEWENMKANGWDRIWDCGSIKYQLIITY